MACVDLGLGFYYSCGRVRDDTTAALQRTSHNAKDNEESTCWRIGQPDHQLSLLPFQPARLSRLIASSCVSVRKSPKSWSELWEGDGLEADDEPGVSPFRGGQQDPRGIEEEGRRAPDVMMYCHGDQLRERERS